MDAYKLLLAAGIELASAVVAGIWLGSLVDKHLLQHEFQPAGTILGALLGFLSGTLFLIRMLRKLDTTDKDESKKQAKK